MSFSFNFDVQLTTKCQQGENHPQNEKQNCALEPVPGNMTTTIETETVKAAVEHIPPATPHSLLNNSVSEVITIGTLPPIYFLNESVFEQTASERDDCERILTQTAAQSSDLITGVYEGGLKVWECTYDLLELLEREGETFGGKTVLDLGCGAGLLGILALKRGASWVHFQDYNSTVIQQLTLPNTILNCQVEEEEEDDEEETKEEERKGKKWEKCLEDDENAKSDWTTFLALVLKEDPPLKYDIIFTSETIYNIAYYSALHNILHRLLAPGGVVYLATKAHYFGVGGGLHLFEKFMKEKGVFDMEKLWVVDQGLQRHVVALHFKTKYNS
ncbi:hypothetical protein UPYG_G00320670 [Umbra pygmaea]|uniref:protein-histidine N-methyltransferase n=1 Tax=Umbra pygmaea TaxID=75934 RepID=A0ABD0W252_UMBPY